MIHVWLLMALLVLAASIYPLQKWCMQDHVSMRTNTIVTTALITAATLIMIATVLLP